MDNSNTYDDEILVVDDVVVEELDEANKSADSFYDMVGNEVASFDNFQLTSQDMENVRMLVSSKGKRMQEISEQYKCAQTATDNALELAENIQGKVKFGHGRKEIYNTKESVLKNAEAICEIAKTQKLLQEYQTYLSSFTNFLFSLTTSSIAMNRSVVRELEVLLKDDGTG